jgi:phosphoglycerate kinase
VGKSLVEPDRIEMARASLERRRRAACSSCCRSTRSWPTARQPVGPRGVDPRDPGPPDGARHRPLTVDRFAATLKTAKTIVWNGPMGVFEKPPFAQWHRGARAGGGRVVRVLGDRRR